MSVTLTITHNAKQIAEAIRRGDTEILLRVGRALVRGAAEVARDARTLAPKDTTGLTNAIRSRTVGPLESHVIAAKEHASHQEQGTRPGGRPTLAQTMDWIRRKGITARTPGLSQKQLAFLIRRRIAQKGVPKQPYMEPALRQNQSRLDAMLRRATTEGLNAIGGTR